MSEPSELALVVGADRGVRSINVEALHLRALGEAADHPGELRKSGAEGPWFAAWGRPSGRCCGRRGANAGVGSYRRAGHGDKTGHTRQSTASFRSGRSLFRALRPEMP